MLLDDKYILTNKKELKNILKILEDYGYFRGYMMDNYIEKLEERKYIVRAFVSLSLCLWAYDPNLNYYTHDGKIMGGIDGKFLLREYKLKRILK